MRFQPRNKRNLVLGWLSYSDLSPRFEFFPLSLPPRERSSIRRRICCDFATIRCFSGYLARFNARRKKVYKSRRFAEWCESDREIRWHVTGPALPTIFIFFLCFLNSYLSVITYNNNNSNKLLARRIFSSLHNFKNQSNLTC